MSATQVCANEAASFGSRLFAGFVVALTGVLLASCTSDPPTREVARPEMNKVLVIASAPLRPFPKQVVRLLQQGGLGSPPLPPIEIDFINPKGYQRLVAALRDTGLPLESYRAVYTTTVLAARAVQIIAPKVPIVFEGVDDPVERCVVDSIHRPGRNATGFMNYLEQDDFKMLELLRDAYPGLRDVWMPVAADNIGPPSCNPDDAYWTLPLARDCRAGERTLDEYIEKRVRGARLSDFARSRGLRLHFMVMCESSDFRLMELTGGDPLTQAWLVSWQTLFDNNRAALIQSVNASRMPAIYPNHAYVREGGLMSLATVRDEDDDRPTIVALFRVLNGGNPAEIPVQAPRGFTLKINAAVAERMPVRPSLMVLRRADEVLR